MLIDNIFDYDTYIFVNDRLKKEWSNIYNKYDKKYFEQQHSLYNKNLIERLKLYNFEISLLDNIINLCNSNLEYINNLKPKTNLNLNYTEDIKKKLLISFKKIKKFCLIKKEIIYDKLYKKKIKNTENTKNIKFDKYKSRDKNKFYNLFLILLIIFIIFLIL